MKIINSFRFISNLIDNLTEKLYQKNVTLANVFLIMVKLKIILLLCTCIKCEKYKFELEEKLNDKIYNSEILRTYRFCDWDLNKFLLLLRKWVYPYKYIDSWSKIKKISLPNKERLYSSLNLEYISN